MKTVTANSAKQQLGLVLDSALTSQVSITKHGRPAFAITSKEDYDSLVEMKFEHLKREVQTGFDTLDRQNLRANRRGSVVGVRPLLIPWAASG